MSAFAIIKSGGIVRFLHEPPVSFDGIQRFRALPPQEQAAHGVVPCVNVTPVYDPALFVESGIETAEVFADRVEAVYALQLIPIPTAEELIITARKALDEQERQQAKREAQILSDINMTPVEVAAVIEALFPTPPFTNQQRTFLKRLVRLAQIGARAGLR